MTIQAKQILAFTTLKTIVLSLCNYVLRQGLAWHALDSRKQNLNKKYLRAAVLVLFTTTLFSFKFFVNHT